MRVYVRCAECGERIYLDDIRTRRSEYPASLTVSCSSCGHTGTYRRSEIEAEADGNAAAAGMIVGGIAGVLAGPVGVALGAGVGGALGNNADQEEQRKVEQFYDDRPW